MGFEVACICGKILTVSEGKAGSCISCECGRDVRVPSLGELRTGATPSPILDALPSAEKPLLKRNRLSEIIAPMPVSLSSNSSDGARRAKVIAALTPQAIAIQDTWQFRSISLEGLVIERQSHGTELALSLGPDSDEELTLAFPSAAEGERWRKEVQKLRQGAVLDRLLGEPSTSAGVALVRVAPHVPHLDLGPVKFSAPNRWAADRGIQLRAGLRGADAIIDVHRQRCPDMGGGARQVSGLAIRVEDEDARNQLRRRWYAEEIRALVKHMLLLLAVQATVLFIAGVFCAAATGLNVPTGETLPELLMSRGLGVGMVCAGPVILIGFLWVLRWPQLLGPTGLALVAVTAGRGLTVWIGHLSAVRAVRATLAEGKIWMLLDPVDWAIIITGIILSVRAWRLKVDARQILPREDQVLSTARAAWSRGLYAAAGLYALVFLGFIGSWRYQASVYILQPGIDSKREEEALLALNQGIELARKGDLSAAEQSWQRSLRLWQDLTARRSVPSNYRINLAQTLYNLGWLNHQWGRLDKAEEYYAQAVALGDELGENTEMDSGMNRTLDDARQTLAVLRRSKAAPMVAEKDRAARAKYEEAQVKEQKGDVEAENLYTDAIVLWEEILPQATEESREYTFTRLAFACLTLGDLQDRLRKRSAAEVSLKKGIDYGEKALALNPNSPLLKHNLETAKSLIYGLRDQALQEEIAEFCKTQRFADAFDLCVRSIEEQEERLRSGKDHESATRRLAYCLDRFAWFLAHCPDPRVHDTNSAIKQARRATELQPDVIDYTYTLAMVQYRNGSWRESLASVEKLKAKLGTLNGQCWFLSAMNLHHLNQRKDARAAFQKADEWIEE